MVFFLVDVIYMYTMILIIYYLLVCVHSLKQLSFSGGGSFGAIEIGIIKKIVETNSDINYDLYTGISAGALNAGFLSYYSNIETGIKTGELIYSSLENNMIYKLWPYTGISLLNSQPLNNTLTSIISNFPKESVVSTLIGATNMYSGKLDIYNFNDQNIDNRIRLLMASSAIPGIFPPINFHNQLYADGGTLSNELLQVQHDNDYLNITYITPYEDYIYNSTPIINLKDMLLRTAQILLSSYNNPLVIVNQNCNDPIGEINKYYVPSNALINYDMMDFNNGKELIDIGYRNVVHKKYRLC